MPQMDLETLVSACAGGSCSDRKIACETLDYGQIIHPGDEDSDRDQPEVPPDFPPESFWLAKDAELDWLDRNAFLERKDSAKGNNNSNSTNLNLNQSQSSQRFSVNFKSKASILGLPKLQSSCFVDSKSRRTCKPVNARLFPKRAGSAGKSEAPANEPSSPKVSCMGRVRSKKDRNRRLRNQQQIAAVPENPKPPGNRNTGFFAAFCAIFRCKTEPASESHAPRIQTSPMQSVAIDMHDITNRLPAGDVDAPPRKSVKAACSGSRRVGDRGRGAWVSWMLSWRYLIRPCRDVELVGPTVCLTVYCAGLEVIATVFFNVGSFYSYNLVLS